MELFSQLSCEITYTFVWNLLGDVAHKACVTTWFVPTWFAGAWDGPSGSLVAQAVASEWQTANAKCSRKRSLGASVVYGKT